MAFRASIFISLAFIAAFPPWRPESLSLLNYGIQSLHLLQFDIQSRISNLAFRVIIPSQLWRSGPSSFSVWCLESHLQFGIQIHHLFFSLAFRTASPTWCPKSPSFLNYGVQSLHLLQFGVQSRISNLAFRVTISSQLWHSGPSSSSVWCLETHLQFGRSKPLSFFSLAFRTAFPAWRSESLSLLSYGVQGLHLLQFGVQSRISSLAFRAAISSQFGLQSHVFSLAFRATIHSQFGC